jgi:Ca2+-binding EF-hand superfamily protein
MINEVDESNTGKIEFYEFLRIYEKYQDSEEDEQDMIDAFVAMGGNADKSGEIDS